MSTILYAENNRDYRELFAIVLRGQGHTVHEARNGAQAVQIVRDESIDLAILDVRMPMVTGFEAARKITKDYPDLPIMFLTPRSLPDDVRKAYQSSPMVVDYLVQEIKVSHKELVARVETILAECQSRGIEAVRTENMNRELVVEW